MLSGQRAASLVFLVCLGVALFWHWMVGDRAFEKAGSNRGTATGLGGLGAVSVFEWPHTGSNYLLKEMIHVVGRRHARKLRVIAFSCSVLVPMAVLGLASGLPAFTIALIVHLVGAFAQRWLFFAQAEHVVGLYYGKR